MLDGLAAGAHGQGLAVEPVLHGVDDRLVLPTGDSALLARRASPLDRAGAATRRIPIAAQRHAVLHRLHMPDQLSARRAAIDVLVREVDEVGLAEAPVRL